MRCNHSRTQRNHSPHNDLDCGASIRERLSPSYTFVESLGIFGFSEIKMCSAQLWTFYNRMEMGVESLDEML